MGGGWGGVGVGGGGVGGGGWGGGGGMTSLEQLLEPLVWWKGNIPVENNTDIKTAYNLDLCW